MMKKDVTKYEMTAEQIAKKLGITVHAVNFYLKSAKRKIREQYPHLRDFLED